MVDKATPIWQLTVGEFIEIQEQVTKPQTVITPLEKKYVYGITGIAELFSCSKTTANSIKQSGKIDKAIVQIGRKIAVDAELAMSLVSKKR
jgi:hypothetical protein